MKFITIFPGLICIIFVTSIMFSTVVVPVYADGTEQSNKSGFLNNPLKYDDVYKLITDLLKLLTQIAIIVCTFFIIYGGFTYVTAAGDTTKIQKAHATLLWSVVGTAVLLGASVLSDILGNTVSEVTKVKLK